MMIIGSTPGLQVIGRWAGELFVSGLAGRLPAPEIRQLGASDPASLTLSLPAHSFALVETWK
jgi:hypothetical protein